MDEATIPAAAADPAPALTDEQYTDGWAEENTPAQVTEPVKEETPAEEKKPALPLIGGVGDRQGQYMELLRCYPGLEPADVPREVWQAFDKGAPLAAAYAMHENSRLTGELDRMRLERDNGSRSLGPSRTAGSATQGWELAGW